MVKKDDNLLKELFDLSKNIWRHRKGFAIGNKQIIKDNTVTATVLDTIDALWDGEIKPLVVKTKNKGKIYEYKINLPPGISYLDFLQKQNYFADSVGGAVSAEKNGKFISLVVSTEQLRSKYKYNFDYSQYKKMHLPVPFGYTPSGLLVRDLADAPNLLIAGVPGSGKSNFLHVLTNSILLSRVAYIIIIDLKRLEFSYMKKKAIIIDNIEDTQKCLSFLNMELNKRLNILEQAGVVKIQDYKGNMPFIVLVIDELAELHDKQCQNDLNRIVRLGRAAGFSVVVSTQRPSSTLFNRFGDSKAMFTATMCFYVRNELNSRMVLDSGRASLIPKIPGRAIYQWEQEIEIQAMHLPISKAKKLITEMKEVVRFDGLQHTQKRLLPR